MKNTIKITEAKDAHENKRYLAEIQQDGETWKDKYFYIDSDIEECGEPGEFEEIHVYEYKSEEDFKKAGWFDDLNNFVVQYGF